MPLPGGNDRNGDPGLITTALADGVGLCAECIAKKTGIPLAHVEPAMLRIGATIRVQSAGALCDSCLMATTVYRLA